MFRELGGQTATARRGEDDALPDAKGKLAPLPTGDQPFAAPYHRPTFVLGDPF